MRSPFPGMDPYLEHPTLWPDVHNSLVIGLRDVIAPQVAPRYFVSVERRVFRLDMDDLVFVGRPDVTVTTSAPLPAPQVSLNESRNSYWVDVPVSEEVFENYLELKGVTSGQVVTVIELLSPANKMQAEGRRQYIEKRSQILSSATNLVEIDLLRAGEPMPIIQAAPHANYRILVSRGWQRPRAQLFAFNLREEIPPFAIPLARGESEPIVELGAVLHHLYSTARYDLQIDYLKQAVPPLPEPDAEWAIGLFTAMTNIN